MNNTFKVEFNSNTTTFRPVFHKMENQIHTEIDAVNPLDAYDEVIYDGGELILPQGVTDVKDKED